MSVITQSFMLYYKYAAGESPLPPPSDLHALQHVEEVVHARQVLYVLEDGDQQRGSDGEGAGQQHPSETRPAQVQETLRAEKTHRSVTFTRKLHLFTTVSAKQTVQGCTC